MSTDELQPLSARDALEWYLEDRTADGLSEATLKAHRYRLGHFVRWCEQVATIANLNDLSGADLSRYKSWRREDGDLNRVSLHTQLSTLKVFIRWAEGVDAIRPGLYEYVRPPRLRNDEDVSGEKVQTDQAASILRWYNKFNYASAKHTLFHLLWVTGMRVGSVRALDVDNYYPRKSYLQTRHKPTSDTPLKMAERGERPIALQDATCEVLDDYIQYNRIDVKDQYGREPLFTTRHGRAHKNTLRDWVYHATRPCMYDNTCPHDKKPETCDWARNVTESSKCPSTVGPHAVRTGAITYVLKQGAESQKVSERMNVSPAILDKNYDMRTDLEKMENRRGEFDDIF